MFLIRTLYSEYTAEMAGWCKRFFVSLIQFIVYRMCMCVGGRWVGGCGHGYECVCGTVSLYVYICMCACMYCTYIRMCVYMCLGTYVVHT